MLQCMKILVIRPSFIHQRVPLQCIRRLHQDDFAAARSWMESFTPASVPARICDFSFSRSSGPGGQNVNKVNSKATLKISLDNLLPLLPAILHQPIRDSQHYAAKSNSLIIQADGSRKQTDNSQDCLSRLHQHIIHLAQQVIPGETSDAQRERVKQL
ncbi:hypothetical protein BT63DRAFT_316217 [Microthyrium microscopicum]|uniref:Prokaryotic-type class I peptide chain release factors domain-containing protein n=1 Tax=Microthyrium microscopicum TaxID=703497 RepID=A0A6A6U6X0_9PEZI|nr:hypothetical protein BT63DRAFT_316217 [Microthyrium microscopicum]